MVPVCVGRCTQGIGVDSVHVRVVVCGRVGPVGSLCAWCSGPQWGGWGSPPGEKRVRARLPPGHKDMLPLRPMTAQAWGRVGHEV